MEAFLYTLAASFIVAITTIAYVHPKSYKDYVDNALWAVCVLALFAMSGYWAGVLEAQKAAFAAVRDFQLNATSFSDGIMKAQIPGAWFLAILAFMAYLRLLAWLPALGLTKEAAQPKT